MRSRAFKQRIGLCNRGNRLPDHFCKLRMEHLRGVFPQIRSAAVRRFRHAVANAGFRKNIPGLCGIVANLSADIRHIDAEDLVILCRIRPPDLFQKHRIRNQFPGI